MTTATSAHRYTLLFSGVPGDDLLADYCPTGTTLTCGTGTFTLANLCTDQAGVLGIIRRLHNVGCLLLQLVLENGEHIGA